MNEANLAAPSISYDILLPGNYGSVLFTGSLKLSVLALSTRHASPPNVAAQEASINMLQALNCSTNFLNLRP